MQTNMNQKGIILRYASQSVASGATSQAPVGGGTSADKIMISNKSNLDPAESNLMPSMIVREQRNYISGISSSNNNEQHVHVKAPATTDQLFEEAKKRAQQPMNTHQQHLFDQNGLVLPKRVLPVFSKQHPEDQQKHDTIRDLHRELKFNQVRGNNVLNQKSELKKAMEKLESNKRKKEAEQERLTRRTSLELRLEERAQKLAAKGETS